MPSVCVYLSSSTGRPSDIAVIRELGREIARRGLTLIYGGAHVGLMGTIADAALASGGKVIGVIPRALVEDERAHTGLTEQHVVDTMHQRKALLFDLADAFIVAPGGFGTLEEAFEQLTGRQLKYHDKPIVFLDVEQFWQPMSAFLDQAVVAGVLKAPTRSLFRIASSAAEALDAVTVW